MESCLVYSLNVHVPDTIHVFKFCGVCLMICHKKRKDSLLVILLPILFHQTGWSHFEAGHFYDTPAHCGVWGISSFNIWSNKHKLSINFLWLLDKPHVLILQILHPIKLRAFVQMPCWQLILQDLISECYGLLPNFNSGQCLVCSFVCL